MINVVSVSREKRGECKRRTVNTRWAYKLVHQIYLQIRHSDALRMIPFIAPATKDVHNQNQSQTQQAYRAQYIQIQGERRNSPITRDHDPLIIIPRLAHTVQLILRLVLLVLPVFCMLRQCLTVRTHRRTRHDRC